MNVSSTIFTSCYYLDLNQIGIIDVAKLILRSDQAKEIYDHRGIIYIVTGESQWSLKKLFWLHAISALLIKKDTGYYLMLNAIAKGLKAWLMFIFFSWILLREFSL